MNQEPFERETKLLEETEVHQGAVDNESNESFIIV